MNFAWPPEIQVQIDRARELAEQALAVRSPAREFDRAAWLTCAQAGVLAGPLPQSCGGQNCDLLTSVAVFEALGRGGADRGLLFALGAHLLGCALPLARFGNSEQHEQWGQALADGSSVAALAITEPDGGSKTDRITTRAEAVDDGYSLHGAKTLVSNAPVANLFLLIASEAPKRGTFGLTAFLVPSDAPGLEVEPLPATLGLWGAPMARLQLDNCRLPRGAVLGRPGGGFSVLMACMNYERTGILAGFLGAAERDLAKAVAYARQRGGDNGTLLEHQAVSHRLARMKTRLESARWMLYRGAWSVDNEKRPILWPAMVKQTVSETIVECALDVLRTFAGAAWLDEQGTATALRDVVGTLSASGTSDVLLNLIAAQIAGMEVSKRTGGAREDRP